MAASPWSMHEYAGDVEDEIVTHLEANNCKFLGDLTNKVGERSKFESRPHFALVRANKEYGGSVSWSQS